ncbi:MAG: hypothetical protein C0392_01150 [Syntrophus sp. (in: bacteria)]|nr:hypothetical protein [Syntrophus sp. (in: bacteria)]
MEIIKEQVFVRSKLKRLFAYYIAAVFCFMICLSSLIFYGKYLESLQETVNKLYRLKANASKIVIATKEITASLPDMNRTIPPGIYSESSEKFIFVGLDDLKNRLGEADVAFTTIEVKDNELRLPVVITGSINDYSQFVKNVGYLQSMRFPFFTFTSLALSRSEKAGGGMVAYEIQGILSILKNNNSPGEQGPGKAGT